MINWSTKPTGGDHDQHLIWDEDGKTIAVVYTNKADANLIVQAANVHAALVAALQTAQEELSAIADGNPDLVSDEVLDQVSDALERVVYEGTAP